MVACGCLDLRPLERGLLMICAVGSWGRRQGGRAPLGIGAAQTAGAALACIRARPGAGAASDSESCVCVKMCRLREAIRGVCAKRYVALPDGGYSFEDVRTSGWCYSVMMRRARHHPSITGHTAVLGGRSERGIPLRSPARWQC
eukprot:62492-Heterocapsa_arctica.AAC.1